MHPATAAASRETPADARSLDVLMAPDSVAVVGASADPGRIGGRPIAWMLRAGFRGTILPVNPARSEVQGLRCHPSVADLPVTPQAAIVAVPSAQVLETVDALGARGVKAAIVFSSGFSEVDAAGVALQQRLLACARSHGMRMLGPNCLGMFRADAGWYPTFSTAFEQGWPRPGRIGIVSQSGAFGMYLVTLARDRGIGTHACVTTGNEADVSVGEVIRWYVDDPRTDVIAAYAEGIRDPAGFVAALDAARRARKPVVMLKVGRSAIGRSAAQSHTASIAGDDAVLDSVLEEFGAHRAGSQEELLDLLDVARQKVFPVRNSLGVITISGGVGVLVSDVAEDLALPMPPMPQASQDRLHALLPYSSPANPVDCTAQALNDLSLVSRFTDEMLAAGGYASVLGFFAQLGSVPTVAPALLRDLGALRARHPDRLFVLSMSVPADERGRWSDAGFTVLEDPVRATRAIAAMGRFGEGFARAPAPPAPASARIALPAATPSEAGAKALLARAGIAVAAEEACRTEAEALAAAARIGFPVVMKILSPDIAHKTEIGGVVLDVRDADGLRDAFALLLRRAREHAPAARIEGVLVARQLDGGIECILGVHRDPTFGPVALFGLGGIFVEALDDAVVRRCPFDETVAATMIGSVRGASILRGLRGRPPADIDALARMLSRLSVFAHRAGPRLRSVDLNPVTVLPRGQGAWALDALIEIDDGGDAEAR
jgi:acyl-CoA synthetase (NDP forming)